MAENVSLHAQQELMKTLTINYAPNVLKTVLLVLMPLPVLLVLKDLFLMEPLVNLVIQVVPLALQPPLIVLLALLENSCFKITLVPMIAHH
jgi:hypothetical protein